MFCRRRPVANAREAFAEPLAAEIQPPPGNRKETVRFHLGLAG